MNPLLLPIAAAQGRRVRSRTELLPPASGPTHGTTAADEISGSPMRLGVLGESTAAGCGVNTHEEGFAGRLARELSGRTGRPVSWEVVGQHGATARRIRYRLMPQFGEDLDVAVLLAGVNDVLTRRRPDQWGEDLAAILEGLTTRARRVVVSGIPPFDDFPSIPTTLGRYLAARGEALDAVSRRTIDQFPRASWVDAREFAPIGPDFFARDRFHPSAVGYERWAQATAEHLARARVRDRPGGGRRGQSRSGTGSSRRGL